MPEVSGTEGVLLVARLTNLVILDNTHTTVKQTTDDGLVSRISVGGYNLAYRLLFDGLRTHHRELNRLDRFDVILEGQFFVYRHNELLFRIV